MSPLQPPEATQPVAFADDQLSCVLPPLATCVGFALNVAVGVGQVADRHFGNGVLTATVALSLDVPPLPVQVSVNVVVAVSRGVCSLPCTVREPLQPPEAMHDCALLAVQLNVARLLRAM